MEAARSSLLACRAIYDMAQQSLSHSFRPNVLLFARSVLVAVLSFTRPSHSQSNYQSNAEAALNTLQQWYNDTSGLWDTTGWWNSANCLTVLADFAAVDQIAAAYGDQVFGNTLAQAPKNNLQMHKVNDNGTVTTFYGAMYPSFPEGADVPEPVPATDFLNAYYDDEGWWALGWIQVYDVTGGQQYLDAAVDLFADMTNGWNSSRCGGGIWWDKAHTYENAIANELFISVAAHLAVRVPANASTYIDWGTTAWTWFQQSGMINAGNTINDGLDILTCQNNGAAVWSYNQGVILGALVELNKAAPNDSYVTEANTIATAAIAALTDANGVLHDPCEPNCGADASQFKGIFARNLQILQAAAPNAQYASFLDTNANAIWASDRNGDNELSVVWSGPFDAPANASTQSSALDALVAAALMQVG